MNQKYHLRRRLGLIAVTVVSALLITGSVFMHAATKKRTFDGKITFKICKKLPSGQWEEIDKGEDRVSVEGNLVDAASGKLFNTNHVWNGTSAKGNRFTATAAGNAKVNADLASGRFDLPAVPVRFTLNGKQTLTEFSFTTESLRLPNGESVSGKRARISGKQGDIALVGFSKSIRVPVEGANAAGGKKPLIDELVLIGRFEGLIAAK